MIMPLKIMLTVIRLIATKQWQVNFLNKGQE